MRPRTQKQPQVKKELCRVLDDVDVDEKRMSRMNKTNFKVAKRRPFVNTSDKLNFDKKNAPYSPPLVFET